MEFEVKGAKELQKKMTKAVQELKGLKGIMGKATLLVQREAMTSMKPGTGRRYKRKSVIHVASAPGQPPAVDTGRLRASIVPKVKTIGGEIVGIVGTNVPYAPYLEFGTSRMAARPFLRRAFKTKGKQIHRLLQQFQARLTRNFNR